MNTMTCELMKNNLSEKLNSALKCIQKITNEIFFCLRLSFHPTEVISFYFVPGYLLPLS